MGNKPHTLDELVDLLTDWNSFYSEALQNLDEDTREFVEATSWAGELHEKERKKLLRASILDWVEREIIGEDETAPQHNPQGTRFVMSRAKKTKKAKKYSLMHSYRKIGEVLNHADNSAEVLWLVSVERGIKPKRGGYGDRNPPHQESESKQ